MNPLLDFSPPPSKSLSGSITIDGLKNERITLGVKTLPDQWDQEKKQVKAGVSG